MSVEHRCAMHGEARCTRRHQAAPYTRTARPASEPVAGEWSIVDRAAAANPVSRWAVAVVVTIGLAMLIIGMAIAAGDAAADGYGPLIPIVTPTPTPFPGGWTP